jgi:predicted kinase
LLIATGFAILGVIAVWQLCGLAGYGLTAHALPVIVTGVPLAFAGWWFTNPHYSIRNRAMMSVFSVCAASACWWFVPASPNSLSRAEAVAVLADVRTRLNTSNVDLLELHRAKLKISLLKSDYRDLAHEGDVELKFVGSRVAIALADKIRAVPKSDFATFRLLREETLRLDCVLGSNAASIVVRAWVAEAGILQKQELQAVAPGDWLAFNHNAVARRELVEVAFLADDDLFALETEWVEESVRELIAEARKSTQPVARDHWRRIHADILALQSLDKSEERFAKARTLLFAVAHEQARQQVNDLLQRGQFDLAYGVARAHAVEWDATAAIAGSRLRRELHSLRLVCQYLAHIYSDLTPPPDPEEIAPPPRAKPEKQP